MNKLFYVISLIFLISCGDNKLDKVETLSTFRVLAIQSANKDQSS